MTSFPLSETRRTLPIALLRARETVMDRFRPMLREIDMTEQQWRVLRVVQEVPQIEATQLAQEACILAPSLTRILKTLENRRLIVIEKTATDRRKSQVSLTGEGMHLLAEAAQHSAAIYAQIEQQLGADNIRALLDALETLQTRLDRPD